jgi:hypothetical protein
MLGDGFRGVYIGQWKVEGGKWEGGHVTATVPPSFLGSIIFHLRA